MNTDYYARVLAALEPGKTYTYVIQLVGDRTMSEFDSTAPFLGPAQRKLVFGKEVVDFDTVVSIQGVYGPGEPINSHD